MFGFYSGTINGSSFFSLRMSSGFGIESCLAFSKLEGLVFTSKSELFNSSDDLVSLGVVNSFFKLSYFCL
jgi:hypothetical protein